MSHPVLRLNKKLKCGVWIAWHAFKYWEDEELAEIFIKEINCWSTFDYPRWAMKPR